MLQYIMTDVRFFSDIKCSVMFINNYNYKDYKYNAFQFNVKKQ